MSLAFSLNCNNMLRERDGSFNLLTSRCLELDSRRTGAEAHDRGTRADQTGACFLDYG